MTRAKELLDEIQSKHASKSPEQLATEALAKVQKMCRSAFDKGCAVGYAKGFEAGVKAAMPIDTPELLV
jgi:flagellar biosynthesis/type III secretory pathway protein FliH